MLTHVPTLHARMLASYSQVLKRLHTAPDKRERKDACKPHGRLLAKVAAAAPLPVLETIIQVRGQSSGCR